MSFANCVVSDQSTVPDGRVLKYPSDPPPCPPYSSFSPNGEPNVMKTVLYEHPNLTGKKIIITTVGRTPAEHDAYVQAWRRERKGMIGGYPPDFCLGPAAPAALAALAAPPSVAPPTPSAPPTTSGATSRQPSPTPFSDSSIPPMAASAAIAERRSRNESLKYTDRGGKRAYNKRVTTHMRQVEAPVMGGEGSMIKKPRSNGYLNARDLVELLASREPAVLVGTLNEMLLGSVDGVKLLNLGDAVFPGDVVKAMCELFWKCYSKGEELEGNVWVGEDKPMIVEAVRENAKGVWGGKIIEGGRQREVIHGERALSTTDEQISKICITVIRNLSALPHNARHLAQSALLCSTLTAILTLPSDHPRRATLTPLATETLLNLAEYYDVVGYKRYADMVVAPHSSTPQQVGINYGLAGSKLCRDFLDGEIRWSAVLESGGGEWTRCVCDLVWSLYAIVRGDNKQVKREERIRGLEILEVLGRNDENGKVFEEVPMTLVDELVSYLWYVKSGPDSLGYSCPTEIGTGKQFIDRVAPLAIFDNKEDGLDVPLRDSSLGLLGRLVSKGPAKYKHRVSKHPGIVGTMLDILGTKCGRSDASEIAGKVLASVVELEATREEFAESRRRMLVMAQKDSWVEGQLINMIGRSSGLLD